MIKELGILASAMSLYTGGVRSPQYRSHEVVGNDIAITYKYETNEVNSNSDLIVGNAYDFSISDDILDNFLLDESSEISLIFYNIINYDFNFIDLNVDDIISANLSDYNGDLIVKLYFTFGTSYFEIYLNEGTDYFYSFTFDESQSITLVGTCVLELLNNPTQGFYTLFSSTSYIPIASVRRVYPDNIFGYVSEFIDEHLLNGIPNIDDVSYTIGGKSITMRSWLNTSICIVLAILLIALLVWFIRYLFRLFSGLLH